MASLGVFFLTFAFSSALLVGSGLTLAEGISRISGWLILAGVVSAFSAFAVVLVPSSSALVIAGIVSVFSIALNVLDLLRSRAGNADTLAHLTRAAAVSLGVFGLAMLKLGLSGAALGLLAIAGLCVLAFAIVRNWRQRRRAVAAHA